MRVVNLFPPDTRSSEEKRRIIEAGGEARQREMDASGFRTFGYDYWDNPQATAGGRGYHYDGRYAQTARRICEFYHLTPGDRLLELGCSKGYLLVEFHKLGLEVEGIDISRYAVEHAHPDLKGKIRCQDIRAAQLPPSSADLMIVKDTLPHLPGPDIPAVIRLCETVSRRHCLLDIEVARNDYEAEMLARWDRTHVTRRSPDWWVDLLTRQAYGGDVQFKVLIEDPALPPLEVQLGLVPVVANEATGQAPG